MIPVLLGKTAMPRDNELPGILADLAFRNAAIVDLGRDFHSHVDRLIRGLVYLAGKTSRLVRPPTLPNRCLTSPLRFERKSSISPLLNLRSRSGRSLRNCTTKLPCTTTSCSCKTPVQTHALLRIGAIGSPIPLRTLCVSP